MTQIEDRLAAALRSLDDACCGETRTRAERHAYRLALIEARAALAEYDTRTPSPASPTRSDTREQAAASPSAVGEGQPVLAYCVLYRDGTEELTWPNKDGTRDENSDEWHGEPKSVIPLSSQAPKPASAGDVRVVSQAVLQAAYEHVPTCQGGHTSEFVSGWSSCLEYLARTIAAEADTAKHKTCPKCGRMRPAIHNCFDDPLREPTDRLAPIEARGAVTIERSVYERMHAAEQAMRFSKDERWYWQGDTTDDPESLTCPVVMTADTLREILRARESAPAVEPSVATGCAGEVTDADLDRGIDVWFETDRHLAFADGLSTEAQQTSFRKRFRKALEAALSQPTRAAGES